MTTNNQAPAGSTASDCSAVPDRYRRHDFYDTKRGVSVYGVDARVRPGKWMHLAENGKPVLFDAPEDRDAKLKELRKALRQNDRSVARRGASL